MTVAHSRRADMSGSTRRMRGSACSSRWCSAPSAASACGRTWSRCRRCRPTSASTARRRVASLHDGDDRLSRSAASRWDGSPTATASWFRRLLGTLLTRARLLAAGYAPNIWMLSAAHRGHRHRRVRARSGRSSPTCRTGFASGAASRSGSRPAAIISAGAIWPPIIQHFIESHGWRTTHIGIGIFCLVTMIPLALMLRRPSPVEHVDAGGAGDGAWHARPQAQHPAGAARDRRHRVLCRDGDAAGAYRRVLRRPRLRRRRAAPRCSR